MEIIKDLQKIKEKEKDKKTKSKNTRNKTISVHKHLSSKNRKREYDPKTKRDFSMTPQMNMIDNENIINYKSVTIQNKAREKVNELK